MRAGEFLGAENPLAAVPLPCLISSSAPTIFPIQNCVMLDEDPAEASRCLFAMPSLALSSNNPTMVATAVTSTIGWLLNSGSWRE